MFQTQLAFRHAILTVSSLLLVGTAAVFHAPHAGAQTITDLFNTGVDAGGSLLTDGDLDTHYTQNSGNADAPNTFVYSNGAYATNTTSNYIAIDQGSGDGQYTVDFFTTFTLPGNADLSTVSIVGNWSTDDLGEDILINGNATGITSPGFGGFTNFTLPAGFYTAGSNTLDFVVTNGGGPGALNVFFDTQTFSTPNVASTPEPGSLALLVGSGVMGAGFVLRKRRSK